MLQSDSNVEVECADAAAKYSRLVAWIQISIKGVVQHWNMACEAV